ncbi:MAG TPA: hypothetical protein VNG90_03535, partial [Candidatus Acidoferrum sp.]|nr:hypothetical protein [Candidatus Acidoferrum sp.]
TFIGQRPITVLASPNSGHMLIESIEDSTRIRQGRNWVTHTRDGIAIQNRLREIVPTNLATLFVYRIALSTTKTMPWTAGYPSGGILFKLHIFSLQKNYVPNPQ